MALTDSENVDSSADKEYLGSALVSRLASYGFAARNFSTYGSRVVHAALRRNHLGTIEPSVSEAQDATSRTLNMVTVGPCFVRGGAEQWLVYLAKFLNVDRVRITRSIITNPDLVDQRLASELPIPIEVGQENAIRRAAAECDVLLSWSLPMDELLGPIRPPLNIHVAHGEGVWTKSMLQRSTRSVDHVIAVSRRVQQAVCNETPSTVIYNGIDTSRLSQSRSRGDVRASLGFKPDDFVLGYVGRFSGEKRTERIIEAVCLLPPNFKALFVGWGHGYDSLRDLAESRIPGRFTFAKASSYLGDVYGAADAICLPSAEEGCALVVLEAMLCEKPVIATAVGAVPELLTDRVNALIVSADPADTAEAATLLCQNPRWAAGLAAEAKAFIERFGYAARMARDYENCIVQLWNHKYSTGVAASAPVAQLSV